MGLNQLLLQIAVMVVALGGWWCDGCLKHEKDALLQIKTSFSYMAEELSSWGNDAHCCIWEGVICDSGTGRVVELRLWAIFSQEREDMNRYLNASLFLPFGELRILDLRDHGFVGCVEDGGFERLGAGLHRLENLYLEDNNFNNDILPSVSSISSLKLLEISQNKLKGMISLQELNNLTNLKDLNLEFNEIEGFKSLQGHEEVLNLSKLESLELSLNRLNNSVLSFINNLPSLKYLSISYNQLQGSFNMKELDSLINLEELNLSGNEIRMFVGSRGFNKLSALFLSNVSTNGSGIVLQSLEAFPILDTLYLEKNNLEERPIFYPDSHSLIKLNELYLDYSTLDEQSLENLGVVLPSLKTLSLTSLQTPLSFRGLSTFKHLEELDLRGSTVNISFLQTVGTMTALKKLDLSESSLNGTLPATQGLCNLKNLRELDFTRAGLTGTLPVCLLNLTYLESLQVRYNNLSGSLSASLANLTSLQDLDLSHNHLLRGEFPYWLLENNTEFYRLRLDGCSFSGPLRLPNQTHLNLIEFSISDNRFHGHIPEEVGTIFPSLAVLDLSNNNLSGEIPRSLAFDRFSLRDLSLSNNNLEGQIFSYGLNCTSLRVLVLDGNQFTGTIPHGLSNLSSTLTFMDLSRNRITGGIPAWMGNLSSLMFLNLSHNGISGSLPSRSLPFDIRVASLSNNKLEGSLAGAFNGCSKLVALDLSHNYFTGTVPAGIESLSQLSYLILRANNLEGDIPLQLCKLKKLTFIDFSHNNLSGRVLHCLRCNHIALAQNFGMMMTLELLTKKGSYLYSGDILEYMAGIDLSFNNLTGEIPPEIGNLTDLKVLNLSYNGLTGQIPTSFSNLKQVESLDLSHNKLVGNIPHELTELNFLEVFYVAYNSLSGKIPYSKQLATFDSSSYEGNPFLCGPPLTRTCFSPESPKTTTDNDEQSGFVDMVAFRVSFLVAYFMVLLAIASVLYINPQWREAWFYFIGLIINKCYYFLVDNLPVPSRFRYLQPCV